jgi:hypothetical protein
MRINRRLDTDRIIARNRRQWDSGIIEIGRYRNIEKKNRLCDICNSKCIGDEYHLLFSCNNNSIATFREPFLKQIFIECKQLETLSNYEKFLYLMSASDVSLINTLCHYVNKLLNCYTEQKRMRQALQ